MTGRVVVVGAGPAGLAAAAEASRAGAAVLVYEERSEPGGQLRYQAQSVDPPGGRDAESPFHLADRLVSDAVSAGATIVTEAIVAGCFAPKELLVVEKDRARQVSPDALIVATGSTDLPYPFAGATLPGVFSARGLRILLNQYRVRPGRRFAIIGGGTEAEELAGEVVHAGGEVVWHGIAPASFLRAIGGDGVRELVVGRERHCVDIVVIAVGRQADPALATMAGVPLAFSAELGGLVPMVDDRMQSPIDGVFITGDAAGVGSDRVAIAEGRLAGIAAATSLGLASDEDVSAARIEGGPELAWRGAVRESLRTVAVQPFT